MLNKLIPYLVVTLLIIIPLYPKFPLLGVTGTFVSVRLEDFVVAFVVLTWVVSRFIKRSKLTLLPTSRSIILYLGLGLASLFSAVVLTKTVSPSLGLLHWLRRIEYMSLFFVAFDCLPDNTQVSKNQLLKFIVPTFLLVSFLVGVYGLGQQYLKWPIISTTNSEFSKGLALSLGPGARINATFAGSYDLAAFSLFPLLLIIGLLMLPVRHRFALILMGAVIYWSMLMSASRVPFLAFYVTTAGFLWVMHKRKWLVALGLVAVISLLVSPQLLGRYSQVLKYNPFTPFVSRAHAQTPPVDLQLPDALKAPAVPEDRSLNIRLNAGWPKAIRSFEKNPLFGTGYSSVGLAVDNDFLRLLAETGLIGTVGFLLIFLRIFQTGYHYLLHPELSLAGIFVTATTFGLVGIILNAMFIDIFEASKVAIVTWTLLGLSERMKLIT